MQQRNYYTADSKKLFISIKLMFHSKKVPESNLPLMKYRHKIKQQSGGYSAEG